ncbi:glycosyl hydrolase family 43 [Pyrenophora seminiperda CCB06]|uniref:Glycosyl hydrolase family 43 n=1 Tax=Pyrenophora seminiperda CCB06 TaxID=1302712 RepID=A0A3M7MGZ8_9PLEO|nr:glycosyl hydrolase family 43 [Pyrenophora seminiperda CCB06]
MPPATLRAPSSLSTTTTASPPHLTPPLLSWLSGPWHVTHSTLPMWKSARNVLITYTPLPSSATSPAHIDDLVTYQSLSSSKLKTVRGVDKPFSVVAPGATPEAEGAEERASLGYNWRGKGLLMIATSKWEILGYGEEEEGGNSWVVTYFAKTLFTPAGVDFYSRKGRLSERTVGEIKAGLEGLGGEVAKLAEGLFEVKMDDA